MGDFTKNHEDLKAVLAYNVPIMTLGKKLLQRVERIFKLRFAVLYPAGAAGLWILRPDETSLQYGSIVIAVGLLLRSWANGYAIKMDKLTTSGPYGYLRHPLYAGTVLMLVGFAVLLNSHWWGVLFVFIFMVVYVDTMRKEERMLEDKFGDAYRDYRLKVPPLWPRVGAYKAGEKWPFAWERYWRSQEYKLILWAIILILFIFALEEWRQNPGVWSDSIRVAAGSMIFLALADVVITIFLKSRSRSAHA